MNSAHTQPGSRRLGLVIAIVALGAIAWGAYAALIAPNLTPRNFGVVEEGKIYRSAALTPAATKALVEDREIRTIIDFGGFDQDPALDRVAQQTAEALGVKRHHLPLSGDGTGNPNAYVAALRILSDPANHPVLVHCSAGAQRTSACVMLYRHIVQGKDFKDVYSEAFRFDHDPGDNRAMAPYLLDWSPRIERAYREGGWIPGHPGFELGK